MNRNMRFRIYLMKQSIKATLCFIKNIPGYIKLHRDYGYNPDTYGYIIENYETVLCERTKVMSKPTYHWKDVVRELDRWYEEYE